MTFRNLAAFDRGQARFDNAAPPEDFYGWEECPDCHGEGCPNCSHEGGEYEGRAMSLYEYRRRQDAAISS